MSILYLPFYLIAHLIALFTGHSQDGFSLPYQWSIFIESIFITIFGFVLLQKLLRQYFTNLTVQLSLVCFYLGTNMIVHTSMYSTNLMTHNYLFMLYALLMTFSDKYKKTTDVKYWYLAIFCTSIMTLVRPIELISILIPLLWTLNNPFVNLIKYRNFVNIRQCIISFLIILAIGSIQFIYWKSETGQWIINSYYNAGEGLDLLNPHIIDYLFSFRKGWLIYTPLVVISLFGFILLKKHYNTLFYPSLFIFIVSLYLTSSWSVWWYAGSFSSRAAIPTYSYLILPFSALLHSILILNKRVFTKVICASFLIPIVALNLFQTWQYHKGIIHPDRMTKAAYLKNFLKLNKHAETENLLLIQRNESGNEIIKDLKQYTKRIIGYEDMEYGIWKLYLFSYKPSI